MLTDFFRVGGGKFYDIKISPRTASQTACASAVPPEGILVYFYIDSVTVTELNANSINTFSSNNQDFSIQNIIVQNSVNMDEFFIYPLKPIEKYNLKVFNMLGAVLFDTNDINRYWRGENCTYGYYLYEINYVANSINKTIHGKVILK